MSPILRLLRIMRPVASWLLLGGLLSLLTLLANLGLMAMSGWFIAAMALAGTAGVSMNYFTPAAVIRACAILRTAGRYAERLVSHEATLRLQARLRVWFYQRLEPLAPACIEGYRSGDLLSRLRADIDTLDHFYLRLLLPALVAMFAALLFLLFLLWFDPWLALIEGLMLAIAGLVLPLLSSRLAARSGERINQLQSDLRATLVNDLQGMGELLIDGADQRHAERVSRLSRELELQQTSMSRRSGIAQGAVGLSANLAMWLIVLSVIPQIRGGEMPPAQLAMLALFALASFEAVAPLPSAFLGLGETLAAAKRVFDLADSEPAVWDPASPAPLPDDTTIEVADASFTYAHGRAEALHCVSFSLPPGGKLALIGPSGSGKSTLLQLLLKFRAPDGGRITFGGQPLDDLSGEALRGRIAVATQQSHLFNTTIRENLLLASPGADQTALEQVCRLTLLHDFIEAQPEGYDTLVGETGIRLSGGQARRLTLARALLKDAPVLILDEPTESLDPHTERALMRNILQWAEGRSLLLITHRLQGLEAMDEILIMREGQIADRGSHQQLTHSSEIYNRLLEQQLLLDPPDESVTE